MGKKKSGKSSFGTVRHLPSGQWQARYPAEDGRRMNAPHTFATSREAHDHLAKVQADRSRGTYHDPRSGKRPLADYAEEWIDNGGSRGHLAERTRDLYEDLLKRHIAPSIGRRAIGEISPSEVRSWYTALSREMQRRAAAPRKDGGERVATGSARPRQSYVLLRAVFNTALADGLVAANPCQIRGAGTTRSPERPLMPVHDFVALMEAMPEDLRPPVALTFGAHLRLGEVVGLRRGDLDADAARLRVERQVVQARGRLVTSTTKTDRVRTVDLPGTTMEAMRDYLASVPKSLPSAPLFVRADGRAVTRAQLEYAFKKARAATGLSQYHFHDIRHAGLTLSAQGGATTRELMQRGGHSTSAAAMKYQHAADERGRVIAASLDAALRDAMKR